MVPNCASKKSGRFKLHNMGFLLGLPWDVPPVNIQSLVGILIVGTSIWTVDIGGNMPSVSLHSGVHKRGFRTYPFITKCMQWLEHPASLKPLLQTANAELQALDDISSTAAKDPTIKLNPKALNASRVRVMLGLHRQYFVGSILGN